MTSTTTVHLTGVTQGGTSYGHSPHWQTRIACRGADPTLFVFDRAVRSDDLRVAREFCGTCPVAAECLAQGVRLEMSGVCGGEYLEGGVVQFLPVPKADYRAIRERHLAARCPVCDGPAPGVGWHCSELCRVEARRASWRALKRRQRQGAG